MATTPPRIAVVDYGAGNLRSVSKALERSGMRAEICGDPASLRQADGMVLPGVGAFADAARSLREKGLDEAVLEAIRVGRPYLGLCLGLQVLFDESDEHGVTQGLGLLPGRIERFRSGEVAVTRTKVPLPHVAFDSHGDLLNGRQW